MTWGPCTTGAASLTAFSLIITTIYYLPYFLKSTRDNHECFYYARETYLPSPVLMISISPSLMKIGTCTTRPVSNVAGFVTLEAVSPLIPGSVSVTCNSTVFEVQHQVLRLGKS